MNLIVQNFRHAREILAPGLEWKELEDVARNIGRDDVLAAHKELARKIDALERKYDAQFKVVFETIRQMF